jgi:FkbH-like protein
MSDKGNAKGVRRVLLVGDTTLDPLGRMLDRESNSLPLRATAAPYGQIFQILLDASHPVWSHHPDVLVVWTTPQLTLPAFARLLRFEFQSPAEEYDAILNEAAQFADAILSAARRVGLILVPTWVLPPHERWIQTQTWRHGAGLANVLAKANLRLAEKFAAQPNIVQLDSAYWHSSLEKPAYDPRMFAFAKILYSPQLFERASAEIRSVLIGMSGRGKKVVVCDLDNTLWGGVIGDDGPQNINLGSPDPVGECFQAFQMVLKGLRSRGILLAISSKNDEQVALSAIESHPAMVLRKSDFVAWRINWNDKAANLLELADELNLGLDSFVFLDDSPQERDQVRQLLPQVLTPDLPASPASLAPFLSSLDCFETPSLGQEDFERTEMYHAERSRKETLDVSGSVESWLESLKIEVRAARLRPDSVPRAAQLLNKTNQFNLSLRRLDEKGFWEWSQLDANSAYTFHVSDRFGDFGLAGLSTLSIQGTEARIVDFVMSCRVMGKKVEEALLGYTVAQALAAGADRIAASVVDGPRNGPARDFFAAKNFALDKPFINADRIAMPPQIRVTEEEREPSRALSVTYE